MRSPATAALALLPRPSTPPKEDSRQMRSPFFLMRPATAFLTASGSLRAAHLRDPEDRRHVARGIANAAAVVASNRAEDEDVAAAARDVERAAARLDDALGRSR
jgi:hypothetical protein